MSILTVATNSTFKMNGHIDRAPLDFDVAIIGSGISGINAAYRVQTQAPAGTTYAILEARNEMGGTWSFFKYPGIRSDSDLFTFGFQWRPWQDKRPIADGDSIMRYLKECASAYGIDKKVRFGHKLVSADWSSTDLCWTLQVDVAGAGRREFRARFLILGTGYYDYENPLEADIPGLEKFKGKVVHPQFWPEDLDYKGKRMVIIGSGATAVTLLPVVAQDTEHVVMLQRSPTYVFSLATKDPIGNLIHFLLPDSMANSINRVRWIYLGYFLYYFCRLFPNLAKGLMKRDAIRQLPKDIPWDPHFKPSYNPWDQRLCLCPDGDFYKALKKHKASVATGKIKTVTENGIELEDGSFIGADIIVTATGLKILLAGGTEFSVDGKKIVVPEKFLWKGVMLQDLPNAAFVVGYTNASWTLGADATARMITRLMNVMHSKGVVAAVPRLEHPELMKSTPMLNLNSTYINKALNMMPKSGEGQWAPRSNYFTDVKEAKRGDIESGLQFYKENTVNDKANGTANGMANGMVNGVKG